MLSLKESKPSFDQIISYNSILCNISKLGKMTGQMASGLMRPYGLNIQAPEHRHKQLVTLFDEDLPDTNKMTGGFAWVQWGSGKPNSATQCIGQLFHLSAIV